MANAIFPNNVSFATTPVVPAMQNNVPVITVAGSTSGNLHWSQPERGSGYKVVIVILQSFNGVNSITFSTPFTYTPAANSGLVTSISTTGATFTASGNSGVVIITGI